MTDNEKKLVKIIKDMCKKRENCCKTEVQRGNEVTVIVDTCPLNRVCDKNKYECSLFEVDDDQHLLEILTAE
ncbi:MAG: hypothetical protein MJ116_02765 [Lachnospiraceae bacterium]|nr:hypothetical protein [Lachnospiraceae bacterium]